MQVVTSQSTVQATVQGCDAASMSKLALSMGKLSARARKSAGSNIDHNDTKLMPGSADQCILGNVYLRSNLSRKLMPEWHAD